MIRATSTTPGDTNEDHDSNLEHDKHYDEDKLQFYRSMQSFLTLAQKARANDEHISQVHICIEDAFYN